MDRSDDSAARRLMRAGIERIVALGRMPDSTAATVEEVERWEALLATAPDPVTDEEAIALVSVFGSDDFFGLAFSIRHLVETAPGWPIWETLTGDGPWDSDLIDRARNSGYRRPDRLARGMDQ
jgi:hypothetical protein